jgi:drug/metabolite transporter (DMT)-like permease
VVARHPSEFSRRHPARLAGRRRAAPSQRAPATPWRPRRESHDPTGRPLTGGLLALAASLSWGVGDFIGGFKTRSLGTLAVLLVSQAPTLVILAIVIAVRRVPIMPGPWIVAGLLAGLIGLAGLAALYRGMAIGVVSVVAAIAATAPIVPIAVGLALGERPSVLQFGGMLLALAGIALLAFDRRKAPTTRRLVPGVGLALLAALAFGFFLVAIRYASRPDVLYGVVAVRTGSVGALLVLGLVFRSRIRVAPADLPALFVVGVLDVGADILFAFATTIGLLSIVSILASLYPVITILLARVLLNERMARLQQAGIVLAFAGVVLISR